MHIPSAPTSRLRIIPFDEALRNERQGSGGYDRKKWLYVPNSYCDYRYILGTCGKDPLICIGINPSTAEPDNLDNTLKSVERIALANGHDSFIMFNVYAQRATNPDDMDLELNMQLHTENMRAFEYILSCCADGVRPAVWAAWGTIIEKRPYLASCVRDMLELGKKFGSEWWSIGNISKKGHPHHPLYLPKNSVKESFDIESYLSLLDGMY